MNMLKGKILLLSGEFGDGHKQAANAIVETAYHYMPKVETMTVDFMELIYPKIHRAAKYLYMRGISRFPSVYGYLFQKTRRNPSMTMLKKLRLLGLSKLLHLLNEEQPDAVVCTFPIAAAAVSLLKANGLTQVPMITVITDYTDHAYWIHPHTDKYIVGSNSVKEALIRLHIPEHQIAATGIPLRLAFEDTYNKIQLCENYRLSNEKQIITVMGGGYGMISAQLLQLIKKDALQGQRQWNIICGHNHRLYALLQEELAHCKHVRVYGFIDYVHELMAISDLLITKPGGLTTSEALSLGLPMLLYRPLPGQEEDNATFLVEAGAAVQAENNQDLADKLEYLLNSPAILYAMQLNTRNIRPQQSGLEALHTIIHTLSPSVDQRIPISAGASMSYLFYT